MEKETREIKIGEYEREHPNGETGDGAAEREPLGAENADVGADRERLGAEIARKEARAAAFGNWGRAVCALTVVALCICLGMGSVALRIAMGVAAGVVIVGYLAAVMILTRRLDALRRKIAVEDAPLTETFAALAAAFDADELRRFTDRVKADEVRAFRDPQVLETQFTFADKLVVACEFDNTEARVIYNFHTEAPYRLAYEQCESTDELFDALIRQIEELRN